MRLPHHIKTAIKRSRPKQTAQSLKAHRGPVPANKQPSSKRLLNAQKVEKPPEKAERHFALLWLLQLEIKPYDQLTPEDEILLLQALVDEPDRLVPAQPVEPHTNKELEYIVPAYAHPFLLNK